MARVLIVEDNRDVNALLAEALSDEGHDVVSAHDGVQGRAALAHDDVDVVVLDLMLPYVSGSTLLAEIRAAGDVPVIVLSAKDAVWSKIDLLRLGADDYVTKPFDLGEVSARVDSLLRRARRAHAPESRLTHRDLVLDTASRRVSVGGHELVLTATEHRILELLMTTPGRVLSKAAIYEDVWNEPYLGDDNALKTHISNLRAKLRTANPDALYLDTVWGLGYRMARD